MKSFKPITLIFVFLPFMMQAQIVKVMTYNLLNYEGFSADTATRNPYFRTIMHNANPDLLLCEEIKSFAGIQGFVTNVMNDSADLYSLGDYLSGFDTNNGLIYRTDEFTFISNMAIASGLRDINEFTVVHNSTNDTLRIYAVHLKSSSSSSDEADRASEVDSLRKRTNVLPLNTDFIVCGDFNIYSSSETAYEKLLQDNDNDDGNVNDVITFSGTWNNPVYAMYHTQSPRVRNFGGGVTGGMDDRFDMILMSSAVMSSGGIHYIEGSMTAVGNDGNHYNDSINHQPNTAVAPAMADALHYASDHLPVTALFEFEQVGIEPFSFANFSVTAFPNPFSDELYFSIKAAPHSNVHLQLTDVAGKLLDEKIFSNASLITYHPPALSEGVYFYTITETGGRFSGIIVKE